MTRRIPPLLAVLAAVAIAYASGLFHPFLYDDLGTIAENPFLTQPDALARILLLRTPGDPAVIDGQRPVLLLSAWIDHALWGLNPFGWHLTSLLLHLAAVAAFHRLLDTLLRRSGQPSGCGAWVGALLFGLHPVLSEAVQLPSYREDLLAGLFTFLYLDAVIRRRYGLAIGAFALALGSKESAAFAPALVPLLVHTLPAARPERPRTWILHLAACAGLLALSMGAGFSARPLQAAEGAWNGVSLRMPEQWDRIPAILVLYLELVLVPWPLCADRAVPVFPALPGLLIAAALIGFAWHYRELRPIRALGCVWILLAFQPVSNVIPLFNPVAERYLYLILPGVVALGVEWVHGLRMARIAALAVAALWFVAIPIRLHDWRSDEALWDSVSRTNPESARALTWLGLVEKRKGHPDQAAQLFRRAEALNPHDISALANLAVLYGEQGDLVGAEQRLRAAIARRPDRADLWQNLTLALRLQGRVDEAALAESEARRLRGGR